MMTHPQAGSIYARGLHGDGRTAIVVIGKRIRKGVFRFRRFIEANIQKRPEVVSQ